MASKVQCVPGRFSCESQRRGMLCSCAAPPLPGENGWSRVNQYLVCRVIFVEWARHGRCVLCGELFTKLGGFRIDHDHRTLQARGAVCARCNIGLGHVDNGVWLARALDYVKDGHDNEPPNLRATLARPRKCRAIATTGRLCQQPALRFADQPLCSKHGSDHDRATHVRRLELWDQLALEAFEHVLTV